MVVTFNEDYLEKLYSKGETGTKKIWFQPQIVRGYQKGIKYLIQAKRKEDLYPFKSLHFEALHGDKEGRFSIKANDQYRIEFTLEESDEEPVEGDTTTFANDKYFVKDVHYGNVIEQKDGKLVIIDANATYNEGYKRELFDNNKFMIYEE